MSEEAIRTAAKLKPRHEDNIEQARVYLAELDRARSYLERLINNQPWPSSDGIRIGWLPSHNWPEAKTLRAFLARADETRIKLAQAYDELNL